MMRVPGLISMRRRSRSRTEAKGYRVIRCESLESREMLAAEVVISEFMARNGATLVDGFGDSSDWIELHNASDTDVDLTGWTLTDDPMRPSKWQVPAGVELGPFEYYVVFASGRNQQDPEGRWHTNFRLAADGEYVGLFDASGGLQSEFGDGAQEYPPQWADVSYGRGDAGRFPSSDVPKSFPAGSRLTHQSLVSVREMAGSLTEVSVTLDLTHEWVDDLDVYLVSPTGTRVELFTDVGGSGDHFSNTTLSDSATQGIAEGSAPFAGRYRPETPLRILQGESPNGTWTLEVTDDFAAVGGTLNAWSLHLTTTASTLSPRVGFMATPTPGEPNTAAYLGRVDAPSASMPRGFYTEPFSVEVWSPSPAATVYWTRDGSVPGPENPEARVYREAIVIETTTVFRTRAYEPNKLPSRTATETYLFLDDVIQQPADPAGFPSTWEGTQTVVADYEMDPRITQDARFADQLHDALTSHPTISLTMSPDDWFDAQIGIYANSEAKGDFWERAVSVEMFGFPDGRDIQLDAGVRMQGNASRWPSRPKHNLRVAFRSQYGPSELEFPLFEGTEIDTFNSIVLRGGNGDSWTNPTVFHRAAYLRDQWHRDMQIAMGHQSALQDYAHLYLNGLYFGLFHLFERVDASFMAQHFGGSAEDYDVIKDIRNTGGNVEAVDGTTESWLEMVRRAEQDLSQTENYDAVLAYLDLENFVDYVLLNFYSGNRDWDRSNWRAGRLRDGGKFQFFAWDSERTDLNASSQRPDQTVAFNVTDTINRNYPTWIHRRLMMNDEYRLFFADRAQQHLFHGGVLSPERAAEIWNARAETIRTAIIAEAARWGDTHVEPGYGPDDWEAHLRDMNENWFPQRTDVLLSQLRRANLYPPLEAPEWSQQGGRFTDSLTLELTQDLPGTVYFTWDGSDPRAVGGAIANLGTTTFELVDSSLVISETAVLSARRLHDGQWSALMRASFTREIATSDLNRDGQINAGDIDFLCQGIDRGDSRFDLDQNRVVDEADLEYFVTDQLQIKFGDINFDRRFDSADLVSVFQAGEYDDAIEQNSSWSDGDWNCDGEFDSGDLVFVFQRGGYE